MSQDPTDRARSSCEVITIVSGVRRRRAAGDKIRLIAGAFPIQCLELSRWEGPMGIGF